MGSNLELYRARLMAGAATGLVMLCATASAAYAQDAEAEAAAAEEEQEIEEVVVTGIRSSIESSIAAKKSSSSIVEVISAEDIGKLPDISIAESLARLPGLAAQRIDGRGQVISVRGLSPDFTTALLNGREQVSAGNNRAVEFDQYPSEMISQVIVYKTPDAGLIGQGLAGTIDMHTISPLAYGKRTIALGLRGEVNDLGALNAGTTNKGYRGSFSYVNQFADDTVGVAIGYARMSSPSQSEAWDAWGYPNAYYDDTLPFVIGGAKPYVKSSELVRDGLMGVLEYRPHDSNFSTTIDVYYSKFDNTQIKRGIELPLQWSGASLQPDYVADGDLITEGTFNNVKGVVRNDVDQRDSKIFAIGWNTEYQANEDWLITADVSYSRLDRTDIVLEMYSGTGRPGEGATDNLGFAMDGDRGVTFSSTLDYSDPGLIKITGPQGWGGDIIPGGQAGYFNQPTIDDELTAFRLDAERAMSGPFSSIEFGFTYKERRKAMTADEWYVGLVNEGANVDIPSEYLLEPTALDFLGIGGMISYDPLDIVYDSSIFTLVANPWADVAYKSWSVKEKVLLGYVQANIDTEMGSLPLSGNVGVQVVRTDQSSNGVASTGRDPSENVPVSGGDKYTYILPSLNLTAEVGEDSFIRLAAARTMARPRMDEMKAATKYGFWDGNVINSDVDSSPWSGDAGNPQLRPWLAWAFDLSYEKYFGEQAYFAIAGFYKHLESYVYSESTLYDFSGLSWEISPAIQLATGITEPLIYEGFVSQPQNGRAGKMYGIEFTASVPFNMIAEALDGFGVTFSYSYTGSAVRQTPEADKTVMPGLSKSVLNTTVYYEKDGIQARISNRKRSRFLGEISGFGLNRDFRWINGESIFDAQVGYDFQSGSLEGLSVLFQANNLTNEAFSAYQGENSSMLKNHENYGRTFLLGLRYKM